MKKKIAITYPQLHEFGGGEIFCEHISNLLIKYYEIDLYFYKNVKINRDIKFDKSIKLLSIQSNNFIIDFFCKNYIFLAQIYLIYIINNKFKKTPYYFIFSGSGEFVSKYFKVYQYIHHPFYSLNPRHYFALGLKKTEIHKFILRYVISLFVRFYFFYNRRFYKKNITFVNSNWTKKRFFKIYKKNPKVIYPTFNIPKQELFNYSKFLKRKNNFVMLGRVGNDKKTFEAIKFFSNFKKKNLNLKLGKLLIVGPIKKKFQTKVEYFRKRYINDVKFYGQIDYIKRNKILISNKYGLHLSEEEHFGRSLLEMQKKGMLVFAHNSGGAKEIIFNFNQKFSTYQNLEKKIKKLVNSKYLQRTFLINNQKIFSKNFTDLEFNNNLSKSLKK